MTARAGWRPRLPVLGMLSGALAGLGATVLLGQFAVAYPTAMLTAALVGGGAAISVISANLLAARAVPQATATDGAGASMWSVTHRVPPEGLEAWETPDPSVPAAATLAAGVELRVAERAADWARVEASNGWSGWVDARRLEEVV